MSANDPGRVFEAPLNACVGADGHIRIFFPSGESITLTAEAAVGSSLLLAEAAMRSKNCKTRPNPDRSIAGRDGNVISFDRARCSLSA